MPLGRPGLLFYGRVISDTGAGVALPIQGCHSITVKADINNLGLVYVGDILVTAASGFDLTAGESITVPVCDASTIFHMASVNGQVVHYIGVT
jgi:hypothetical protein